VTSKAEGPDSTATTAFEEVPSAELIARAPVRPDSPTFADLGARAETVAALAAVGITRAFAIQEYALPIALRGNDLIGQAPTGTGKTLGFGIPLLEQVISPAEGADGTPQALVVVPTRELGLQVARDIQLAGRSRGVRVLPVYGGVAYEPQVEALQRGVEIIVGTPGRLLDLSRPPRGKAKGKAYIRLDRVRALVLDEADRMLDLGFLDDVEKILAMLPDDRQTMLFSATMPDPIVALARRFLRQPVTVHARHDIAGAALTKQVAYRTHPLNKLEVVARILQSEGRGLTMIFTRTKRAADRVAEDLDFRGFAVAAVHGDLGQGARERALRAFRNGKIDVLVATDVAARGLDVTGVTHVINYDCPEDPDTYTHRIGRTGRAGATGLAVTFVDWEDMPRWRIIDKTLGLEMAEPPETYHTSPHLFTDLSIDAAVSGTLPAASRKRAGLGAEVEEDLGGGSRRRDKAGRPGSARPGSGRAGSGRRERSSGSAGTGNGAGAGTRSRAGTAAGADVGSGAGFGADMGAGADTGSGAETGAGADGVSPAARVRRRRRGGTALRGPESGSESAPPGDDGTARATVAAGAALGGAASDGLALDGAALNGAALHGAALDGVAVAGGTARGARRRSRRRGRGSGGGVTDGAGTNGAGTDGGAVLGGDGTRAATTAAEGASADPGQAERADLAADTAPARSRRRRKVSPEDES
jgi:superfamily II DNA/RNA helicase